MIYSSQSAAFRRDKHQFFSQFSSVNNLDAQLNAIDSRARNMGYTFLLKNQAALETEFTQMFSILQQLDDEKKEVFLLYCYYCASLLEAFYLAYSQPDNANKYRKLRIKIENRLNHDKEHNDAEMSFIQSLQHSFFEGFDHLVNAPFHTSQIRDYVAYSNLCRIYWTFCRLTLTQGLSLARDFKLIEQLDAILGTHTDVNKIIATIQAPTFFINYFSVGFFLMRFMIDGGLLLRHTFFPTELEKGAESSCEINQLAYLPGTASLEAYRNSYIMIPDDEDSMGIVLYYVPKSGRAQRLAIRDKSQLKQDLLDQLDEDSSTRLSAEAVRRIITAQTDHVPEVVTCFDRFKHELYKRHCNFANDLVWATVNFLANFKDIVHISGPVAGFLTSAFLVFDVGMTLYKCNLAKQEYLVKKAQYIAEREEYHDLTRFKRMSEEQRRLHIEMLDEQLMALEINWRTKEATFYFAAAAAALLMLGFTASMLVSPALMVAGCYFACTVAVAMYLSSGSFSKYQETGFHLEQAQLTGKNLPVALRAFEAARNDFIFTLLKNTLMPLVLITTFAICWPAAVVLTAMYIGCELYHAHEQHSESRAISQLALAGPQEEIDDAHLLPVLAF